MTVPAEPHSPTSATGSPWRWQFGRPPKLLFVVDVRIWLLLLVLVALAVRLAMWQHDRAEEKRADQEQFVARMAAAPVGCEALANPPIDPAFLRVSLVGTFDAERTFLLDNRTRNGVAGYQVVHLLQCDAGPLVLVDRGWVAVGANRLVLPKISPPLTQSAFTAFVYVPPGSGAVLASELPPGWPKVVNHLDAETLAATVEQPVYEHRLIVEAPEFSRLDGRTEYNHEITEINVDKHVGYMVQWLGIAIGIFFYGLFSAWQRPGRQRR